MFLVIAFFFFFLKFFSKTFSNLVFLLKSVYGNSPNAVATYEGKKEIHSLSLTSMLLERQEIHSDTHQCHESYKQSTQRSALFSSHEKEKKKKKNYRHLFPTSKFFIFFIFFFSLSEKKLHKQKKTNYVLIMGKQLRLHFEQANEKIFSILRSWGSNSVLIDQVRVVLCQLRGMILAPETVIMKLRTPLEVISPIVDSLLDRVLNVEIPKRAICHLESELMTSRELLFTCEKELYQRTTCALCISSQLEKFRSHLNTSRMQYLQELTILRNQLNIKTDEVYAPVLFTPTHCNEAVIVDHKEKISRLKTQLIKERVDVGRLLMNVGGNKRKLYKSLKQFRENYGIGAKILVRAKMKLTAVKDIFDKLKIDFKELITFVDFAPIVRTLRETDDSTNVFCSSLTDVFHKILSVVSIQPKVGMTQRLLDAYTSRIMEYGLSISATLDQSSPATRVLVFGASMRDAKNLSNSIITEMQNKIILLKDCSVQISKEDIVTDESCDKSRDESCQVGSRSLQPDFLLKNSTERNLALNDLTSFNWIIAKELFMFSKLCVKLRIYGDDGGVAVVQRMWGNRLCILSKRRNFLVSKINRITVSILKTMLNTKYGSMNEPRPPSDSKSPLLEVLGTSFRRCSSNPGRVASFRLGSVRHALLWSKRNSV